MLYLMKLRVRLNHARKYANVYAVGKNVQFRLESISEMYEPFKVLHILTN